MNFLKGRKAASGLDPLREGLVDATGTGDEGAFDRLCRDHKERILEEFEEWLKVPRVLRTDPEAAARYMKGMTDVANWFARNGAPHLLEALQGAGRDNPILRWEERFGEADTHKIEGRFAEAIEILEELVVEIGKCQGSAVERYLPMVHGSLGECLFRSGQLDLAYEVTRTALDGCQRSGDVEGIIAYCGNLAEICRKRGDGDEERYWLIISTNAMIQVGQVVQAAEVRRAHGLEPTSGLIEAKGPLG